MSERSFLQQRSRVFRSTNKRFLSQVTSKNVYYGFRAFSVFAPELWNRLSDTLRLAKSVTAFKTDLKTHYFGEHFIDLVIDLVLGLKVTGAPFHWSWSWPKKKLHLGCGDCIPKPHKSARNETNINPESAP